MLFENGCSLRGGHSNREISKVVSVLLTGILFPVPVSQRDSNKILEFPVTTVTNIPVPHPQGILVFRRSHTRTCSLQTTLQPQKIFLKVSQTFFIPNLDISNEIFEGLQYTKQS